MVSEIGIGELLMIKKGMKFEEWHGKESRKVRPEMKMIKLHHIYI